MKNYLLLFATLVTSLSFVAVFVVADSVEAKVTYSCPAGQTMGRDVHDADVRYCYTPACPSGQSQGSPTSHNDNKNPNKCYTLDVDNNKFHEQGDAAGPTDVRHGEVQVVNNDGLKCPDGSYRGGLLHTSMDEGKCYTCSGRWCNEVQGQSLVPVYYQACLGADRACIRAQEEAQEKYMEDIRASAPRGFTLPDTGEDVRSATIARMFCEYYRGMEWITQYDTEYTFRACIIGYEVGFGKGDICSKPYLFGHYATHRPAPTAQAESARDYIKDKKRSIRDLIINDSIKACLDGWAQYSTDYWWCEGRGNCLDLLRDESSRTIDPGPRPNKKQYINEDGDAVEVSTNVVTSQSCGSVQTAFFACNLGQGLQNSSFWQIIQMILNILIGLVGIAAVGGLAYGAARYSSAGDNAEQVKAAKTIIKNVIIGLVLFLMMWAFIQYVIPGGIFS